MESILEFHGTTKCHCIFFFFPPFLKKQVLKLALFGREKGIRLLNCVGLDQVNSCASAQVGFVNLQQSTKPGQLRLRENESSDFN